MYKRQVIPPVHRFSILPRTLLLSYSIERLARSMRTDQFRETSKYFSGEQFDLIIKKGVYPYDYMDSIGKVDEATLPGKRYFYNRLNKTPIDSKEYKHAWKVWNTFKTKTLTEYTLLYKRVMY